ncbi:helix-turn-helix domain-containing protein [Streptomyces sioyaensis]|uniref:IclR family transcriptional regulator n=1 Tax=Streptomyces sioyaensis TaxID=67364 RepID=A0A4Q1QXC4_9ACTN|nr:IclR family transcriptional regulator C-terminal domain-containing protein [Streptomyces sioyaensis]MBM4796455.1 helix-turn-helix domain-containing protein [Streptomyces sioyaensis]RXS66626.1 IclR family transcriptional regulator [Streptomyces sioyaensis]
MPTTDVRAPAEAVGPLIRGIAVLRELTEADGRQSLGGLSRGTALARSTVDRIAATLTRMGYVRQIGRDIALTPRLMELGNAYLGAIRLPDLLGPHADRLADALDESVSLAVPDRDGIRFVHQATRRRALSLTFRLGDLLPAERTAHGQVFAADWTEEEWAYWRERWAADPENLRFPAVPPFRQPAEFLAEAAAVARTRGWAVDDQMIEPGLIALVLPVRDAQGRQVCGVSVVSHTSRHSARSLREAVLPTLRETVAAMEDDLRHAPPIEAARRPADVAGSAAWTQASKQELGREFVEALARGLTVLTAFGPGRAALPLTAVAEATGLARATARRALITLEHLGYVTAHGREFSLTPRVLDLGFAPLSCAPLSRIAEPHLADLAVEVQDSASLAVLAGDDVQYTARIATRRVMSVNITVGTRFPAFVTSMGRVLLADLPPAARAARLERADRSPLTSRTVTDPARLARLLDTIARDGYALVDEELEEGLRSIAVPIRDRTGRAVAAVNIATHTGRRSLAQCRQDVLPALRTAAARIENDLHTAGRYVRIATTS